MKMTDKHVAQLEAMIRNEFPDIMVDDHIKQLSQIGLSEKRIYWDLLWAVPFSVRITWFDEVYTYLTDDHIYTALKKVVKNLLTSPAESV